MNVERIRRSIRIIGGRARVEVSGGVDLKNIRRLKGLRIDYISIGALTHSSKAVDISLEFK